jgi:hypothetical protein
MIAERRTGTPGSRSRQQLRRQVEAIHTKAGLGEKVGVSPLTARHVEDTCAGMQPEDLDHSPHFASITL